MEVGRQVVTPEHRQDDTVKAADLRHWLSSSKTPHRPTFNVCKTCPIVNAFPNGYQSPAAQRIGRSLETV
jgi:hypothetical protein